ncbi:hypothetical protein [Plantactinospora soyae]|uniref:Uncharacterized protein n=1 Tax=Plantactinospora soyae TaxID=1544732 RepID=A0A927MC31_9ACTN|nr:hypothetical protein [Plantactinospora soyae]MBE1490962.1 hypothetical protein [Plantactinospora soyae]
MPLPAVARQRISAWISKRGSEPGLLFTGQRGPLSVSAPIRAATWTGRT